MEAASDAEGSRRFEDVARRLREPPVSDVFTPPSPRAPGAVAGAGFFGERWELQPDPPGQK